MEQIKIKGKIFDIVEQISHKSFKVTRKNKEFLLKRFVENSLELEDFIKKSRELKISGISIPKVQIIDKKSNSVILDYIPGPTALDVIVNQSLDKAYYEKIFEAAWYAEHEKITLDFRPDNWKLYNGRLYYLPFDYVAGYDKNRSFDLVGLRYWFYTKELADYINSKGLQVDKMRLKDEYATNKEIVMCACQYHI
ncbi:MAG: hypothetical protein VB015_03155 [Erysipelotrichaceae bacterium]|nr:hypothetical protein [Erysipelotrichaceae bacterium]